MKRPSMLLPALMCAPILLAGFLAEGAGAAVAPAAAAPAIELPVSPVRVPVPVIRELPNGLRVAIVRDTRLPIVQMQLLVPAGGSAEPDSLPGIAALTAAIVDKGTSSRSSQQIASELAALGASMNVSASRDYAQLAVLVRPAETEALLELMSDVAINALLAEEDFGEARRLAAQQLGQQRLSASAIADDRVWAAAFRQHPYAHLSKGEIGTLLATRRDHLHAFYRNRWRPSHAVLSISGDVDTERVLAAVTDWFGRWSGRTVGEVAPIAVRHQGGVQVVDLEGARWSEARLAWIGAGRSSSDYAAWQVMATMLQQTDLPAGARVSLQTLRDASLLTVSAGAPTDSIPAVVRRIWDGVRAFASVPPGGAIESARRELAQSYPLKLETLGAFISQWQAFDHAGQPADAVGRHLERLRGTVEVTSAARTLSQPPQILIAGPGAVLREKLASFGEASVVPYHSIPIAQVDTLAAPTAEQLRRGKAVLEAAVSAHGGAAGIKGTHTTVQEGDMLLYSADQEISGQFSIVRVAPDRYSFATKMLEFESRQVLAGDSAWTLVQTDSAVVMEADSLGVAALKVTRASDLVHLLQGALLPSAQVARRGSEVIAGRNCDLVDFRMPNGRRWRLLVDEVTHRVTGVDGELGPDLKWHDRRLFSRYEPVSVLLLPFIEERFVEGVRVSRFSTNRASINQAIDRGLFVRPRVVGGVLLRSQ